MRIKAEAATYPEGQPVTTGWMAKQARAMLVFMAPALILPLSDPLMSLIDAVCLGRVRSPSPRH